MMTKELERQTFQILLALGAMVPLLGGFRDVLVGLPEFLSPDYIDLDSHYVFMSGVLMAIGAGYLSCVAHPELKTQRIRLLSALIFTGGLCRLLAWTSAGQPSNIMMFALFMEVAVAPLLTMWQGRIAKRYGTK